MRGAVGVCLLLASLGGIVLAWPPAWWQWILGVVLIILGAFVIFEASVGWCAVRAMGFRTRI